jgi:hypothetical protein
LCPNYNDATARTIEKIDDYSFGVLLLVLLTKLPAIDNLRGIEDLEIVKYVRKHSINDIVTPTIKVACTRDSPEDCPIMVGVTKELKELRRIERLVEP